MKHLVAIVALFVCVQAYSQEHEYQQLLMAGRSWHVADVVYGDTMSQWTDRIDCEVEYLGKKCFQVSRIYSGLVMKMLPFLATYHRYMYEEDGRVYETNDYEEGAAWKKTFDFTLSPGEEGCTRVDTIKVNGFERRRIYIGAKTVWVEGVGNANWGLIAYANFGPIRPASDLILTAVYDGDACICTHDDLTKNAVTSVRTLTEAYGNDRSLLFNLQGCRLTAQPQRGLYIRDGRKYVVK